MPKRIIQVAGARPNFVKIASIARAMARSAGLFPILVHTGQHYDEAMSRVFFDELGIPRPDINLEVGSASHAVQTAEIMRRFEEVAVREKPDLVLVVGDVNSTIACALVSVKLGIPVAHVEAGLRSFDRTMPEEINRVLTDAISTFLLTSEPVAEENLRREGIPSERISFVGNCMIDTLLAHRDRAVRSPILGDLALETKGYALVTLHRPSNVDDAATFEGILRALADIAGRLPVVFPVHPRTRKQAAAFGLADLLERTPGMRVLDPVGYLDFLCLMTSARLVLTDSGGIQEETTVLGVPCLTLRENTERPITMDLGTNRLVGADPRAIIGAAERILHGEIPRGRIPPLWDGRAADRIIAILEERL
ncbi:MAG: UDP-N-acetylglucosamine 2-epimerase (non-hydrolyzing) [Planctomycetes bacterium]|nr:UDP-N-acetylglucosamine 2-epimerase (non-hydrolyzing) [Planctomycetota bacterium]